MFVYLEKELDLEAVQRAHQADQSASCQAHLLQGRKLNGSSGFDPQIDIIQGQRDIIQIGIDRYYIGLDRYYIDRDRQILHRDRQGQTYITQGQIGIDIYHTGIDRYYLGIDRYIQKGIDRYQMYIDRDRWIYLDTIRQILDISNRDRKKYLDRIRQILDISRQGKINISWFMLYISNHIICHKQLLST